MMRSSREVATLSTLLGSTALDCGDYPSDLGRAAHVVFVDVEGRCRCRWMLGWGGRDRGLARKGSRVPGVVCGGEADMVRREARGRAPGGMAAWAGS